MSANIKIIVSIFSIPKNVSSSCATIFTSFLGFVVFAFSSCKFYQKLVMLVTFISLFATKITKLS